MKVSVIIPIYNCQEYLWECLQSLSKQTISDFEIILVDDGSQDNSLKICEEYKITRDNVKVIHTDNNGVSSARNIGLKNANGELIIFIDADDILEKDYLKILSEEMECENTDLVCCRYRTFPTNIISTATNEISIMDISNFCIEVLSNIEIGGFLWNKIFRRKIIDRMQMMFPDGISVWEDKYFVLNYLKFCQKVKVIDKILYNYRQHENSAISVMDYKKIKHKVWVDGNLIRELHFPECVEFLKKEYFRLIIDWGMIGKKSGQLINSDKKKIINTIIEKKGYKYLNFKRKLVFIYLLL